MKKTLLSFVVATILGLSSVWAQSNNYDFWSVASNGDTLWYKITSDTTVSIVPPTISYDPGSGSGYNYHHRPTGYLIIPSNVYFSDWEQSFNVTEIAPYCFASCNYLDSVEIPSSISEIGSGAFYHCIRLKHITLPSTITQIKSNTFNGCIVLQGMVLPDMVTTIEEGVFRGDSLLLSVFLPNSVQNIGERCFHGCKSLKEIVIPDSCNVGFDAFGQCDSITSVTIGSHVNFQIKKVTHYYQSSTQYEDASLFSDSPIRYLYYNCGMIREYSYYGNYYDIINKLGIVDSIRTIVLGDSVVSIGDVHNEHDGYGYTGRGSTYESCNKLDTLIIGSGVTNIQNIRYKGKYLKYNCPVNINSGANVETLVIGDNVSSIEATTTSLNCSHCIGFPKVRNVQIGNGVQNIPPLAFAGCDSLRVVSIGSGVEIIGGNAFYDCDNLKLITMGSGVDSVGSNAFYHCMKLDTIIALPNAAPVLASAAFAITKPNKKVIVPCNSNYDSVWGTTGFVYITGGFSLTLASNNDSWGSATFVQSVDCEQTAIIEATPTLGHVFLQWSDGNTDNPRTITLSQNTALTAVFEAFNVDVSANCSNNLMGSVTGGGNHPINSVVTLTAVPACGYRFVRWNDSLTINPRVLTADKDTSFTAYFELSVDTLLVHDTTYIDVHDTTYVDVFVHDTSYVDVFIHDTTFINIHDTTYIDVFVHDTTTITDTITLTEYVPVHDTTFIPVHDTTYINVPVHDTTVVTDTVIVSVHDTTYITQTDTLTVTQYDTIDNYIHDTTYVDVYIHDTITITDTITVQLEMYTLSVASTNIQQGLAAGNGEFPEGTVVEIAAVPIEGNCFVSWNDGNTDNPRQITITADSTFTATFGTVGTDAVLPYHFHVYAAHDVIVVENAEGNRVRIFDAVGRILSTQPSVVDTYRFQVPASGVYMIQVGDYPARKVTIVR